MDQLQREYLRGARRKAQPTDYFDADDSGDERGDAAHSSRTSKPSSSAVSAAIDTQEDEVDPLDAFMLGIDAQVQQQREEPRKRPADKPQVLNHAEDDTDSYMEEFARSTKKPRTRLDLGDEDSDEEVYATAKRIDDADAPDEMAKKVMEVLAPVDHLTVQYEPFRRAFYTPHEDTAALSVQDVKGLRAELSVRVDGGDVPAPVRSFMHLGFDKKMLGMLMKLGLEAPTAIQAQAFPVALTGRDLIGIAKTGSGKTLAFTLPMVRHVMDQRELQRGEGPIAVVLAPTRELAHQTYVQAKKFLSVYGASCAAIYGGAGKWDQVQALRKGVEVVVATPGRLIEMIRKKAAPMSRVTFVVLDEADRMFEMGFEAQLRSVMGQIRPDCQTLMFSATFRRRIEALALDVLKNPVKITIGQIGQANEDIRQVAVVLPGHGAKWPWLMAHLRDLVDQGRLLIFASSKAGCEELAKNLASAFAAAPALCLHGDKTQQERSEALAKFKSGECQILVATDVAARGLDVKEVKNVVNFDVAKNIDIHVHRIGRTGRMGHEGFEPGTAYTLVTRNEIQFAAQLVYNMDVSRQPVSEELLALAKRDARFRRGGVMARGTSLDSNVDGGGSKATNSSEGLSVFPSSQQPLGATNSSKGRVLDAEDAAEMQRWNESRQKSKAKHRQGLGFTGATMGKEMAKPGGMRGFVKASMTYSSLPTRPVGFVKPSVKTNAAAPLPPPKALNAASLAAPPPPPFVPKMPMTPSAEQDFQQVLAQAKAIARANTIARVPPPLPPAVIAPTPDEVQPGVVPTSSVSPQTQQFPQTPRLRSRTKSHSRSRSNSRSRSHNRRRGRSRSRSDSRSRNRHRHRSRSSSSESDRRRRRRSSSCDNRHRQSRNSRQSRDRSRSRERHRDRSRSRRRRSPSRSQGRSNYSRQRR